MVKTAANRSRRGPVKVRARAGKAPAPTRRTPGEGSFPTPDRSTRSGHIVGDICFECECRILEIGGPEGLLLAWCDCGYPDDHGEMEIL